MLEPFIMRFQRLEGELGEVFLAPDVRGDDLVDVVDGLLAL
ncbi:hypothetical protein [Nesterenkonia sp. NBAIMH1]|nr:hypothetical protein [Nesterenkonia sp. NBAIMH1]